ncbi:MAG: hypothetical protein EOL87_18235 [Spartobacteria bacterium]|nr:hypothetical protein [Spartobacteria bacterium]NCU30048.1 hypothetical protein [Candidatus Saccharibacteria bacterium]
MIKLNNNKTTVSIDQQGAWVQNLVHDGQEIFFPKTAIEYPDDAKSRGGMHACVPNFGPGGDSNLPQHGYGRTSNWTIDTQTERFVSLSLRGEDNYSDLKSVISYALGENSFTATLHVENTGTSVLRVAPAFHPYFNLQPDEVSIQLDNTPYALSELAGTVFVSGESLVLQTRNYRLKLDQESLDTWALWTDQMGNYVCIEPTLGGYRFLEEAQSDELLQPDQQRTYTFTIGW